jgi:hypothetical protein
MHITLICMLRTAAARRRNLRHIGGSRAVAMTFPSLGVMLLTGVAPGPAFRPARCDWTAGRHRRSLAEAIAPH